MEKEPFVVMAKPVGSLCNMRCGYCYYLGRDEFSTSPGRARMPDELLETFVSQYIQGSPGPVVSFTWHGGEPTLAGLDFYRRAVELQKKVLPQGWECWNNLQTNGLALDDEWCAFLAENRFDVGLSIDGAQEVHDEYRRDVSGGETYHRTARAAERLMAHGIRPDLLCTVTSSSAQDPLAVYRGLRRLRTGWIQFIPILRRDAKGQVTPDSVTPEGYGRFLCRVFDEWLLNDLGRTEVQLFAEAAAVLSGGSPTLCWMAPTCGRVLVVEKDGSVYSCDHFVDPAHRLGNLERDSLAELVDRPEQVSFGGAKRDRLPGQCRECRYLNLCGGGCPKDRFGETEDGERGRYYLCGGLKQFFAYAEDRLRELNGLRRQGAAPAAAMEHFRALERKKWQGIGRNAPCPCGSGRKAKNCCWDRRP